MNIQPYIDKIVDVFITEINQNLIGIYLQGSLAMGCFNPEKSDVDLLVVIKSELANESKRKIVKKSLPLTVGNKNPLVMSMIEKCLIDFVHQTPFDLHYFHPKYLKDENYICGGEGFTDPALAGHIVFPIIGD